MLVLDWDRKTEWACYDGKTVKHVTKAALPEFIGNLPPYTEVYVESAHFRERLPLSVAQVYTLAELEDIYARAFHNNVFVWLFPEILTFRARSETGLSKDEDTTALYKFVSNHPEISLMPWTLGSSADVYRWDYLNKIRNDCTVRLNVMRPDYDNDEVTRAAKILEDNFDKLSDLAKELFEITNKRKFKFNTTRVMSVYVACFNEDGSLRLNTDGKFIGMRTVWAVLKLHPYHRKAGTARSNLMYHMLRNLERKVPGDKDVRAKFRRAIKDLITVFRDAS